MEKNHLDILVYGAVQGVGFRVSARAQARTLGLFGFVRNQTDGCVRVEVEGEPSNIDKFLEWIEQGFNFPGKHSVEVSRGPIKKFTEFSVLT